MSIAALADLARPPEAAQLLTHASYDDMGDGRRRIRESPGQLAQQAGLSQEEYTLARMIASEGYSGGGGYLGETVGRVCLAQAVRNEAKRRGKTITELCTRDGHYGTQNWVIYCATSKDPVRWHGDIARAVLAGDVPDLVRGATNFVPPSLWGNAANAGQEATQSGNKLKAFTDLMASWHTSKAWIGDVIPGLNPYHLLLLKNEPSAERRRASLQAVLDLYDKGRKGQSGILPGNPDSAINISPTVAGVLVALAIAGVLWVTL